MSGFLLGHFASFPPVHRSIRNFIASRFRAWSGPEHYRANRQLSPRVRRRGRLEHPDVPDLGNPLIDSPPFRLVFSLLSVFADYQRMREITSPAKGLPAHGGQALRKRPKPHHESTPYLSPARPGSLETQMYQRNRSKPARQLPNRKTCFDRIDGK
jgi:hypothetical protein